jgi:YceI-like domain
MKCLFRIGVACLALLSIPKLSFSAEPVAESSITVHPGDVDLKLSRVFIFVDKSGLAGHQHAIEGKLKSGQLLSSSEQKSSVVFDMKSFDADTPIARKYLGLSGETDEDTRTKVNENMLGSEILDVNRFPEARLDNATLVASNKMSKRNLPEYTLEGDFVLHETKRHVRIRCDLEEKDGMHHIRGAFKILQTDYGIKPFSKMMGVVGVKDELIILGDLWVVPSK